MVRFLKIFLLLFSFSALSQNQLTDSLKKIAIRVNKDSAAKLYVKIANVFTGVNSDSVRKYARIAGNKASEKSAAKGDVLIQLGNSYHMENNVDSSLKYYNAALIYFTKIANEKGIAKAYQSFALVKRSLNNYDGAISDSKKALQVYEKLGFTVGIIGVSNNISNIYMDFKQPQLALEFSKKAFEMSKMLNDSSKYFDMMAQLGLRYNTIHKNDSALLYLLPAEKYFERNNFYSLLVVVNSNIADAYWAKNKNTGQTKNHLYKSLHYSKLSGSVDNLTTIYRSLAVCHLIENKKDSAEIYFNKAFAISDSLHTQSALQQSMELQTRYETEKKDLQIKQQEGDILLKVSENKRKSIIIWLSIAALVGSTFFGAIAFINFKKTKQAKKVIEEQKNQVEIQKEEITHQKELVDEKQKEIIDSINYAQRIQHAVLTGEDVWNKVSKEHFILFKPKDIVSGDFYWAYNTSNNRSVFALADCTGHGVPGGFMSMLGNSFLNEIVVENKIFKANEILNKLRTKIIKALEQKGGTQQKDGMDISLCVWNKLDNTLEFSGANNPLWLLRGKELMEYKADKMPIGLYLETEVPFSSVTIQLQKADIIYLSTDGYADQFGGPKGKKLKYKSLMEMLIFNSMQPMETQKMLLEKSFYEWKVNHDQVDDVSLVGIRV
jgi:serine phosphatase RsbU (regulator of sigma subunit)